MEEFCNLTVLVVDDDPAVLELTAAILRELGVENVRTADNGANAMALLQEPAEPVDVIVSDVNMPRMNGIELMRRLGDAKVGSGVILASGEDSRMLDIIGALSRSHGLYFLGTLEKPLKVERLVELLKEYDHNRTYNTPPAVQSITGDSR